MQDWVSYCTSNLGYFIFSLKYLKFNKNFQEESQLLYSLISLVLFPLLIPEFFISSLAIHLKICIFIFLSSILVVSIESIIHGI